MLRVCLGWYLVLDLVFVNTLLIRAAVSRPGLMLRAEFVGQCVCAAVQTYLHARLLVIQPLQRCADAIGKHLAAAGHVLALPRLSLGDSRLDDACAVCLTAMDAASSRLTPCGHAFHGKCLELSLRMSPSCPMCRHHFTVAGNQ